MCLYSVSNALLTLNHVSTWITGVETIKRQTRVAYCWLVVGQSVAAPLQAKPTAYMGSTPALSVT